MEDSNNSSNIISPNLEPTLTNNTSENSNLSAMTDPLWTITEVAGYLKLQPETVRSMARRGELPGIKIGKVWRFRKSAVKKMFQEQS